MSEWKSIGDINAWEGGIYIRDLQFDARLGEFTMEAVTVDNEKNVGGDEQRALIRQGSVYLAQENFASALDTVGAHLDENTLKITRPNHAGEEEVLEVGSEEWLRQMADAALSYGGIDNVDISVVAQIGVDYPYTREPKFSGEIVVFRMRSKPLAVLQQLLDGFDYDDGSPGAAVYVKTYNPDEPVRKPNYFSL